MAIGSFSLCRLLVSIAVVAVGCAALASPSSHWMCAVVSAKIIILFYAALAAVFRHGPPRAFWAGLAIVGWGYTFITCGATLGSWDTTFYARPTDTRESPLITTRMLALLADKRKLYEDGNSGAAQTTNDQVSSNLGSNEKEVDSNQPATDPTASEPPLGLYESSADLVAEVPAAQYNIVCALPADGYGAGWLSDNAKRFFLIGESLWSLLIGSGAGFCARGMYNTRQTRE
ncbi:MAG TPA: hypothetical protein VF278_24460 [Pirellulales bacterium]